MSKLSVQGTKYCTDTMKLRQTLEEGFLVLGERLHNIEEKQMYKGSWDTFRDYLDDLKIDYGTASKLMKIHRVFVLEYAIPAQELVPLGRENAYEITTVAKSRSEAMVWIKKGDDLRGQDFRIAIKEKKSGVLQSECKHANLIKMQYCPDCHLRERI